MSITSKTPLKSYTILVVISNVERQVGNYHSMLWYVQNLTFHWSNFMSFSRRQISNLHCFHRPLWDESVYRTFSLHLRQTESHDPQHRAQWAVRPSSQGLVEKILNFEGKKSVLRTRRIIFVNVLWTSFISYRNVNKNVFHFFESFVFYVIV